MEAVQVEMMQADVDVAPVQKMEVCCRHGKKRQVEYLEKCPDSDQWMCKDTEQCKMSMKPSKKEKEIAFMLNLSQKTKEEAAVEIAVMQGKAVADQCPAIQVSGASIKEIPLYYPAEIITSWADEVDKEFPLSELEPENKPMELSASFNNAPSMNPSPRAAPARAASESPTDLVNRVGQLEDELCFTKRKLTKAKEEMNRALRNERVLESKLRSLCSELARMRQERAQLGFYSTLSSPDVVPINNRYPVMTAAAETTYMVPELIDSAGTSLSGVVSPQYLDSARSSIDGGSTPATAMNSARSVQFCQPIPNPRIESMRPNVPVMVHQPYAVDCSRSSSFAEGIRTPAASTRSSVYSYGTPYSMASYDSEHFNGR